MPYWFIGRSWYPEIRRRVPLGHQTLRSLLARFPARLDPFTTAALKTRPRRSRHAPLAPSSVGMLMTTTDIADAIEYCNTSSYFADKTAWNNRLKLVGEKGVAAFAAPNMERWFTKQFRERAPESVAWLRDMFAATPLDGYLACGEAVRDMDHRDLLPKIRAPTLVIAGKYDPATPPNTSRTMC